MQIELLKNIVSSVAGDKAKGIVELLISKKNVNEFLIAKKLGLTINQTRNILYKLADEGLVSFIRKKDSKKGGWYTYFWTLNQDKSLARFKDSLLKSIEQLKVTLNSKKTERFYHCPNCDLEFNEENAIINDYTCPECGEVLQLKDNNKESATLEKEIAKNEKILVEVDTELATLHVKEGKVRIRKAKADDKKKKLERLAKKKERAKNKAAGKTTSKAVKKPVKKTKKK